MNGYDFREARVLDAQMRDSKRLEEQSDNTENENRVLFVRTLLHRCSHLPRKGLVKESQIMVGYTPRAQTTLQNVFFHDSNRYLDNFRKENK